MTNCVLFLILLLSMGAWGLEAPRWQPVDLEFTAKGVEGNPFDVKFEALVRGPEGYALRLPGFWVGGDNWVVRFSPLVEGQWTLETRSSWPGLSGQKLELTCVPNTQSQVHGRLKVDAEYPHHFCWEDGQREWLMGYEANWLWALEMDTERPGRLEPFLDRLVAAGFNFLTINVYAHDTRWQPGLTRPDDYGPPPLYPWAGSNEAPDFERFNLPFWEAWDQMMWALWERGLIAHVMIKVYNKLVNWPDPYSSEEQRFLRWLIARYAAFPNLVWDFSKEAYKEPNLQYRLDFLTWLQKIDPYDHLITVHDMATVPSAGDYWGYADFRSDQNHEDWHARLLAQRSEHPWPVFNIEFGYEWGIGGPEDRMYSVGQSPEEVARRAWEIALAGGYVNYYYTGTAWDIIRAEDEPRGYEYFRLLREVFEQLDYWRMEPADELVSTGYCLTEPGNQYLVFLNQGQPFSLKLAEGRYSGYWLHPYTGERRVCEATGPSVPQLTPPDWGEAPVVLLLRAD